MAKEQKISPTVLRGIGGAGVTGEQLAAAARVAERLAGVGHGYEDKDTPEGPADAPEPTKG